VKSSDGRTARLSASEGEKTMSDVQLNDASREGAFTRGDVLAASAIAQFYKFASRCMDWANTTHSLQERAVYRQMALQWLAAGARLQTFIRFEDPAASERGPPMVAGA
jgi:hypothetical protein